MAIKFNRSQTFATNGTVTAAGLHNLIDGTDIYQALITDQTNLTSVGSGDELLIADADLTASDAPRAVTVNELFEDALTIGTYTNSNFTNSKITTGTVNNATLGTTTGTVATISTATISTATIPSLTSTTLITTGTGTASSPAVVPTGDTNTGFFSPAADAIAASTNGTEAIRINSSQNVGIGTTSPEQKLHVQGAPGVLTTVLVTGDGGLGNFIAERFQDSTATPNLVLRKGRGSKSSQSAIQTGDGLGSVLFSGYGGTNNRNLSQIFASVENYTSDTNISSNLVFLTASSSSSPTEKVRITSAGNVGIGTTSPSSDLHINKSTASDTVVAITNSSGSGWAGYLSAGGDMLYGLSSGGNVQLRTNNLERMRIDSSGNVGIGTTSPEAKLHVSGGTSNVILVSTDSGGASFTAERYQDTTQAPNLLLRKARGSMASPSAAQAGDQMGFINFGCYGGANNRTLSQIRADVEAYTSDTNISSNLVFFTTSSASSPTERARITSAGEVYIAGTTDQGAYNLQVNGTGVWGAGAYVNGSDERLKENIQELSSGLDVVEKLRPVTFNYKADFSSDTATQTGFIAQDLLVALDGKNYKDGIVSQGPTYYNVAYQTIIPILTKAIQELKEENDSLKSRISALESA